MRVQPFEDANSTACGGTGAEKARAKWLISRKLRPHLSNVASGSATRICV